MTPSLHAQLHTEDYGDYDELTIDADDGSVDVVIDADDGREDIEQVIERLIIEDADPSDVERDEVVMLDRRVHPRIPVSMRVIELDGEILCYQRAANLSEGGLFLEGSLRRIGKQFTLMFIPPGSSTRIVTRAQVVGRIAGRRAGTCVRFLEDGTSEVRYWLRRYVRQNLT